MVLATWLLAQMAPADGPPAPVPLPHPEIAPPAELPAETPLWLMIVAGVVVLLLVGLVLWLLFRPKPLIPPPLRQPLKAAQRALKELRSHADHLQPPEIANRVSEILRHYFLERYALPAPFRTTPELFERALERDSDLARSLKERFKPLAVIYDEIAFAPTPATRAQAQSLIETALAKLEEERP